MKEQEKSDNYFTRYASKKLRRERIGLTVLAVDGITTAFSRTFRISKCCVLLLLQALETAIKKAKGGSKKHLRYSFACFLKRVALTI